MGIDESTLAHQTFILANYLRSKYAETMVVQLDLLHREYLESFPQTVNTFTERYISKRKISDIFDGIIIEETGRLLPFCLWFLILLYLLETLIIFHTHYLIIISIKRHL